MTLKKRLDRLSTDIGTLDEFAIDTLSRLATWTAPAVPAVLVYGAMQTYLQAGPALAFTAALSIELMGLGTVSNMLTAAEYNRHVDEAERLSMRDYRAMTAAYVGAVVIIVLGLKIWPDAMSWAALLSLSLMTFLSAVSFTQRRQLAGLMAPIVAIEEEKNRAELRAVKRAAKQQSDASFVQIERSLDAANDARSAKIEERRAQLDMLLRSGRKLATGEIAEELGVSPGTVRADLAACYNGDLRGDGRGGYWLDG